MLWVVLCCRTKSSRMRSGRRSVANRLEQKIHHDIKGLIHGKGREVTVQIGESSWYTPLECTTPSSPLSHAQNLELPSFCPTEAVGESSDKYLSSKHANQGVPTTEQVQYSSLRAASDDSTFVVPIPIYVHPHECQADRLSYNPHLSQFSMCVTVRNLFINLRRTKSKRNLWSPKHHCPQCLATIWEGFPTSPRHRRGAEVREYERFLLTRIGFPVTLR
jgi:hypothetical protein